MSARIRKRPRLPPRNDLASLAELFDGDWHLALASYNGGPGRVQRAMKTSKLDDFWKLAAKPRLLPRETRSTCR